jgi:hypothetical protein
MHELVCWNSTEPVCITFQRMFVRARCSDKSLPGLTNRPLQTVTPLLLHCIASRNYLRSCVRGITQTNPNYKWRATGWTARVRFPAWQDYLFSTASRLALRPVQPPIRWVPGASSPGIKRPGREADHSPPPSEEVKNGGAVPSRPHMSSWRGA